MKHFLLALVLLAPLASCSKKDDPAPAAVSQTPLIVGTWDLKTSRLQKTYDNAPGSNSDVTTTITDRQRIFNADGTFAFIVQGNRSTGTYTLNGTTLMFNGQAPANQVLELTSSRLVLTFQQEGGPGTHEIYTNTYTR